MLEGMGLNEMGLVREKKKSDTIRFFGCGLMSLLVLRIVCGGCGAVFDPSTSGEGQDYVKMRRMGLFADSQYCFEE